MNSAVKEKPFGGSAVNLGAMPNTHVLCFVLGWQGGTLHQVAQALGVSTGEILDADYDQMGELCRKAQAARGASDHINNVNSLAVKHLRICVEALKKEYVKINFDHSQHSYIIPQWLERADGVCKILEESL